MGILQRLRTTKVKERLAISSRQFWEFLVGTKVIPGAVGFGLVLVLILGLLPGCSPGEKSLTKEQAIAILLDEVVQPETVDHYVIAFTLDEPLPEDSEVSPYAPSPLPDNVKTLPYLMPETLATAQWFFWVDDAPFARFAHPTRFVFIDVASGAVRVQEEAWWPYVDGQPVSQWITADGRREAKNQAFNNIPEEERPYQVSVILESSQPGRYTLLSSIVPSLTPAPAQAGLSGEAIIPVNGWKSGRGTDAGFTEDMGNMAGFGNAAGIPKYDPRGETLQDIEDAIQRAVDGGADDIFFYFTGHGGRTAAGESFLAFKDTRISPQQLVDMLKKFPKVRFKVVIDACFSGGFVDTLADSGMVDIVLTASSATESSYGDWDPANDPNKGDTGGEYSSGLWEDLNEIQNSPELQERAKQIAAEKGWPEFVAWLTIADTSAIQKDASVINGLTHPKSFISTAGTGTTPQYTLTIRISGNGSATGAGTYSYNEAAPIVATPDAGWEFDYWGGDVDTVANADSPSTTITMDADKAITANFLPVAVVPEIGISITPDTDVVVGDEVTISITGLTPNESFGKAVCVNGDCDAHELMADGDGNFEGTLILDTAGTTTVYVVYNSVTAAEASFEVGEAPPGIPASGSGAASVSIFTNPGGHPSLMPSTLELTWNITGSTITISGIPGAGELTGTLGDGGFFFATGNGTYAGYSTSFRIDGTITPDGISGTLNIGSDGGLPGGAAIVYEIELTFP